MSDLVLTEVAEQIALVTLNRPDKHNALNDALLEQLGTALSQLEQDVDVRVIILTGAGERAFCAGRDMTEGLGSGNRSGGENVNVFALLHEMDKPSIAAVNGYAYGGGALLACQCDIRIADPGATFRFPGAAYGLVAGAAVLTSLVGPARAKELIFSTRVVRAEEAARIGLVNSVVDGGALAAARALATEIAKSSVAAVAASKRIINLGAESEQAADAERAANRTLVGSPEQRQRFGSAAEAVTGQRPRTQ